MPSSSSSTTSKASPSRRSSSASGMSKDPIMVDDEDDNDKIVNSLSKMKQSKAKRVAAAAVASYSSDTNSDDDIQLDSKGKSTLKFSKVNNRQTRRGTPISSAATAAIKHKRKESVIDDDDDDKVIFPIKDPKSTGTAIPHRRRKPGHTFANHSTLFPTDDTDSWVSTSTDKRSPTESWSARKRDAAIIEAAAYDTSPINTQKAGKNNRNDGTKNSPAIVVDAKIIQTATKSTSPIAIATLLTDNHDDNDDDDDNNSGPKTRNGTSTKKRAKQPAPKRPIMPPGMDELDQYIKLAKIEVGSDPYRGIRSIWQKKEAGMTDDHDIYQWKYCYFGSSPLPGWENADDMPLELEWDTDKSYLAQYMSQCTCPSMDTWLHPVKNNTKRKRKPQLPEAVPFQYEGRPENPQFRCVCDANPFCLASLGGIVDVIMRERFREVTKTIDEEPKSIPSPKRAKVPTKSSMDSMAFVVEEEKTISLSPDVYDVDDENDDTAPARFERPRRCPEWLNPFPEPLAPPGDSEVDDTKSPASVFFEKDHNQKYAPSQVYSDTTQQELNQARRSLTLISSKIRHFVYHTLGIQHASSDGPTVCEYMKKLAYWQKSLLFPDTVASSMIALPNSIHDSDGESCTTLAVPPGIQNLGATCYLNSQLQCLAQNPAFLEGIFTWRPPQQDANGGEMPVASFQQHHHDPMTRVLIELQNFLAALVHGGTKTQSTLQFSNALGLEHGEQQDPNEFARLLFERMEDSFRECSRKTKNKHKSDDDEGVSDLGNLLKNIFEGVTTYETTCLKCKTKSERSEGFMDLNVPIVSRPATTSKGSQGDHDGQLKTLKDFWDKSTSKEKSEVDTDVQYCLDEAYQVEVFDGDNQYFCSACNSKQDAERRTKLTKLPPVLNLQLSRYIFDRETFAKKKVSDKVLLPTILSVPYCGDKSNCREFLLCAVMRHQGSSAYRGHYVAEAMDWCTGVWYEFNDERVDYLPGGPSCSHDPSEDFDGKKLVGSQDAYNMYYVDRSFLATQASRCLLRRDKLVEQHLKAAMQSEQNFALYTVAAMRKERYKVLSEFCIQDRKTSARLKRREAGVRSFMFPSCESFSAPSNADDEDPVWVNTEFLRRYLAQDRSMDIDIAGTGYIINNRPYLCQHQRLCPRAARRGKLISSKQFDALISLLKGERAHMHGRCEGDLEPAGPIIDCKLSSQSEIECKECMLSYTTELSHKVELAQLLRSIYPFLNQSTPSCTIEYSEEDRPSSVEEGFAYIVAKSTLSKLKKEITAFVKNLVDIYEGIVLVGNASTLLPETKCEGLDALDLSRFEFGKGSRGRSGKAYSTLSQSFDDSIDEFVNGGITCAHGNVSTNNKTRIRYLSWQQWSELKALFPNAIEHARVRRGDWETEFIDDHGAGCDQCGAEKASFDNLATRLEQWASMVKKKNVLNDLYEVDIDVNSDSVVSDYIIDSGRCRLVHKSDVITWKKTVAKLSKVKKLNASDSADLRSIVEKFAFPSYHSVVLECCEGEPQDKLLASMHSLICGAHKQCVCVAIFDSDEGKPLDENSLTKQLSHGITVLNNDEYLEFVSSLIDLLTILHPSGTAAAYASPLDDGFNEHRERVMQQIKSYHPEITKEGSKDTANQKDGFWFYLDGKQAMYSLFPDVCKVPSCQKEFAPSLLPEKVPNMNATANGRTTDLGSIPANPIIVETEADEAIGTPETGFQLRVFQVEEGKAMDAAISPLLGILGGSATPESELDGDTNLRRSTRKRKSRFPCDVLLAEDVVKVELHHNIAALRLLLLQSCAVPIAGCTLALVITNLTKESSRTIFLEPGWNERSLNTIIEDEKFEGIDRSLIVAEPASHVSLLCQKAAVTGAMPVADETSIMDSLLSTSNLSSGSDKKRTSNGKKRRSAERGFRGTLLSSTANRNGQDAASNSEVATSTPNTVKDTSTVSDEDKIDNDQATERVVSVQLVQHVLSDDDDDDHHNENKHDRGGGDDDSISPLPIETTGKKQDINPHAVPVPAPAPASNTVVVENESGSDMDCEPVESPRPSFDPGFIPTKEWGDVDGASTIEQLVDDITTQLLEIVEQPPDREMCHVAALWAQKRNPRTANAMGLVDVAFGKYVEVMQNNPKETAA